jgi:hypothetical protein
MLKEEDEEGFGLLVALPSRFASNHAANEVGLNFETSPFASNHVTVHTS